MIPKSTPFLLVLISLSALTSASSAQGIWEGFSKAFFRRQTVACGDGVCASSEICSSCPEDCCPNDNCTSAVPLIANAPGKIYSLDGATNSSYLGIVSACYNPNPDLWFFYSAQENGFLRVTTCNNGTNADTTLSLFAIENLAASNRSTTSNTTSSNTTLINCNSTNLIQLACKDDDLDACSLNPLDSTVTQRVVQGFTYLIQVSAFSVETSFGHFEITASFEPSVNVTPPVCGDGICDEVETCSSCGSDCCPNDNCSHAIVVHFGPPPTAPPVPSNATLLFFAFEGSTQGATLDPQGFETLCPDSQLGADVWFLLTPDQNGFLVISTCAGSTFDTTLSLFLLNSTTAPPNSNITSVNCNRMTELNCNDDSGSLSCTTGNAKGSTLYQILERGNHYVVRLGGANQNSGRYKIEFVFFPEGDH